MWNIREKTEDVSLQSKIRVMVRRLSSLKHLELGKYYNTNEWN